MYTYEYIGEIERDFPTLGKRLSKGDQFQSDEVLNNPLLKEIKPSQMKGSDA